MLPVLAIYRVSLLNRNSAPRRWLLPLLLLVIVLGARGLNADAIWYDEYWSLYYAGGAHDGPLSLGETWTRVAQTDIELNPPGYYLALNAWGALAGWTAYAGRALSLLAGVLAVAVTYRLGRDLATPLAGLGAAVALGMSAFYVNYLHEMRGYTLYVLLTAVSLWAYWRTVYTKGGVWMQVMLVISVAGGIYTHYLAAITAITMGIYHLLFVPRNRGWWRVVALLGVAGLLFLPWVGAALEALVRIRTNMARDTVALDAATLVQRLLIAFSNGSVALLALVGGFAAIAQRVRLAWWFVLGVLALTLLANTALQFATNIRYLMALWPLLALLVGLGVAKSGIKPALLLGIWIAAGLWNSADPTFMRQLGGPRHLPLHVMGDVLRERAQPGDVVAFHAPDFNWLVDPVLAYYTDGIPVRAVVMESLPGLEADGEYFRQAQQFMGDAPRVWLGVETDLPPNFRLGEFERALADDYAACGTVLELSEMRLDLYIRVSNAAPPFRFGDDIGMALLEPLTTGETLTTLLGWSVSANVPVNTYSVALHVLDEQGQLVAQADYPLPLDAYACRSSTLSLAGLPPDVYTLVAVVYNWSSGERLPAMDTTTGEVGERVGLGRLVVDN